MAGQRKGHDGWAVGGSLRPLAGMADVSISTRPWSFHQIPNPLVASNLRSATGLVHGFVHETPRDGHEQGRPSPISATSAGRLRSAERSQEPQCYS
jgi:hypothetical protein